MISIKLEIKHLLDGLWSLVDQLTQYNTTNILILLIFLGQYDPGLSSHYLALHQSCSAALYMESLMRKALVDPKTSQQAALLHQRNMLLSNDVTSNASQGPVFKKIDAELMESSINWQRLMVSLTNQATAQSLEVLALELNFPLLFLEVVEYSRQSVNWRFEIEFIQAYFWILS